MAARKQLKLTREGEESTPGVEEGDVGSTAQSLTFPDNETVEDIWRDIFPQPDEWESRYAAETRYAARERALELWLEAWSLAGGKVARAARSLGVAQSNVPAIWRRMRLSRTRLDKLVAAPPEELDAIALKVRGG